MRRMPSVQYCWRCQTEIPMLDETEWAQLEPLLKEYVRKVKEARSNNMTLEKVYKLGFEAPALKLYFGLTSLREANIMNIWHHRASLYGPPCLECGKPLRNPKARICAYCGCNREI